MRKNPEVGCCGINCSLCPKYYTDGKTKCNGCCGKDFWNRLRICSFIPCCDTKKIEFCIECEEFPCAKIDNFTKRDSFVSHKNTISNLELIGEIGLESYLQQLKGREKILKMLLEKYNNGRLKSFYTLAVELLPLIDLERALDEIDRHIKVDSDLSIKERSKHMKEILSNIAQEHFIELRLRKKSDVKNV